MVGPMVRKPHYIVFTSCLLRCCLVENDLVGLLPLFSPPTPPPAPAINVEVSAPAPGNTSSILGDETELLYALMRPPTPEDDTVLVENSLLSFRPPSPGINIDTPILTSEDPFSIFTPPTPPAIRM